MKSLNSCSFLFFLLNLFIVILISLEIFSPLGISFLNFDFIRDRVDFVRLGPGTSPVFVQRIESLDELAVGLTAMFRF